ncbi:MAG: hypothetical protein WCV93_01410 [Candidatus Shapirobacteria bacterium]
MTSRLTSKESSVGIGENGQRMVFFGRLVETGRDLLRSVGGVNRYRTGSDDKVRPEVLLETPEGLFNVAVERLVGESGEGVRVWVRQCGQISDDGNKLVENSRVMGVDGGMGGCALEIWEGSCHRDEEYGLVVNRETAVGTDRLNSDDMALFEVADTKLREKSAMVNEEVRRINGDIERIEGLKDVLERAEKVGVNGAGGLAVEVAQATKVSDSSQENLRAWLVVELDKLVDNRSVARDKRFTDIVRKLCVAMIGGISATPLVVGLLTSNAKMAADSMVVGFILSFGVLPLITSRTKRELVESDERAVRGFRKLIKEVSQK